MNSFPKRSWAQFLVAAGILATGPALAQNVILDCTSAGSDCPTRVPDDDSTGTTSSIVVPASATCNGLGARSVKAGVVIDHSNVGDLRIVLESPLGTEFTLISRPREAAGEPAGSCASDNIDARFVDGASAAVNCDFRSPAITLRHAPETGMGSLAGPIQSGTWLLHVSDLASGGDGLLTNWSLNFTCDSESDLFADSLED